MNSCSQPHLMMLICCLAAKSTLTKTLCRIRTDGEMQEQNIEEDSDQKHFRP